MRALLEGTRSPSQADFVNRLSSSAGRAPIGGDFSAAFQLNLRFAPQPGSPSTNPEKEIQVNIRSKLATAAAILAATVGGAAIAGAATSGSSSSTSTTSTSPPAGVPNPPPRDPSQSFHTVNGRSEKPLSGDTRSKVQAAALAKVAGTVERVETNVDSTAPYEAHIRKADGSEVEVQVNSDYTVAAVNEMGAPGGRHP
jgi:hypothetical protein